MESSVAPRRGKVVNADTKERLAANRKTDDADSDVVVRNAR